MANKLEPYCNEISSWNEEARYNFNFMTTVNLMEKALEISADYISWVKTTIPNVTDEDEKK